MTNTEWRDMHPQWNPLASSLDSTGVLELTVCARPPFFFWTREARALLFMFAYLLNSPTRISDLGDTNYRRAATTAWNYHGIISGPKKRFAPEL